MLFRAKTISGYNLDSDDGEIGKVKEFYFDDNHWTIRYLVADTGDWLSSRQVLISPYALISVNEELHSISIHLSRKQIEESPTLYTDKPVSRQFEQDYYGYYGWPIYWGGANTWGYSSFIPGNSELVFPNVQPTKHSNSTGKEWDPNLRSTHDVIGHDIQALDGEIGHVADFLIDEENWSIRYLVVDTRNWWPGKKVLISPNWIERISWDDSKVFVHLNLEAIKQAPEYTDETEITREYEASLHEYYDRQGYWVKEAVTKAHLL